MTMQRDGDSVPDILFVTFDALRYDVALTAWTEGHTPCLQQSLPEGWEQRHTPGSFTYAAHCAFFAGFFPTPIEATYPDRPFALRFPGSRTIGPTTQTLEGENIVDGLQRQGYHTACIGGVGFFNKRSPLGSYFPSLFAESHWHPSFSVLERDSSQHQVDAAIKAIKACANDVPLFLFINFSATHPPTHMFVENQRRDSVQTQQAALASVDQQLPRLFSALKSRRRDGRAFLMSDHGTLFGEEGRTGHRCAHPDVWNVPYAEMQWGPMAC